MRCVRISGCKRHKDVRAVLLTGAGRSFALARIWVTATRKIDVPDLGDTLNNFFNPNVRLIRDMPKPVIAAVNGAAASAGANIALGCDVVLAAKSAKFLQAFARIGLIPDAGTLDLATAGWSAARAWSCHAG